MPFFLSGSGLGLLTTTSTLAANVSLSSLVCGPTVALCILRVWKARSPTEPTESGMSTCPMSVYMNASFPILCSEGGRAMLLTAQLKKARSPMAPRFSGSVTLSNARLSWNAFMSMIIADGIFTLFKDVHPSKA